MVKKIILSPEQDVAANPAENVWVQANAGTGKTSVLVQRLLRILFRSKNLDDCGILCLTYTKAAAGEMRNRILAELQKWATLPETELKDTLKGIVQEEVVTDENISHAKNVFFKYIDDPELLKIKTIHSFCEEILRRFPLEAGITPSWQLVSDDAQRVLLQDAFSYLINSSNDTTVNEAFAHLISRIDETKVDGLLSVLSERYKDFFQVNNFDKYREYFVDTTKKFLNLSVPLQESVSEEKLKNIISAANEDIKNAKTPAKYLTNIINYTNQYIDKTIDFKKYKTLYLNKDGTVNKTVSKKQYLLDEQNRVYSVNQYNVSKQIFEDTLAVFDLSAAFSKIYSDMKRKKSLLDFEDLILYTRKLFSSPDVMGWVLSQLNVKLSHILVDEAQDTSPVQWDILRLLTGDFFVDGDTNKTPHSLFVVGDTKQSIYGFQGADPKAFDESRIEIARQIQQNFRDIREVPLVQSFRSAPQILYAVDTVFNDLEIKEKTGFVNNTHKWVRSGQNAFVEICKLFKCEDSENTLKDYINLIATKIKSVLSEGIFTANDIMVLVQNREPMIPLLVKKLKQCNIAVAGSDRICLPDFPAIRDLLNLVRFTINNEDDYSLCCVLKSPVFRLKEVDIFNICRIKNDKNFIKRANDKNYTPTTVFDVLKETFPNIYDQLIEINDAAKRDGPYTFFSNILNKDGVRESMISALGNQIIDPLEEFLTICLSYERTQTGTLYNFIKWFITGSSVIKRDMDNVNGVRIATVHSSKGLEAPVVFLIDTVRMPKRENVFPITPELQNTTLKDNFGKAPLPWLWAPKQDESELRGEAEKVLTKQKIGEYYRLLYVGMTRAMKRLYVYGFVPKNKSAQELCWFSQLWRILSTDKKAVVTEETIRIEDVK